MNSWDIRATRELIRSRFGREQAKLASPPIQSMLDRLKYARFHFYAAKDGFLAYVDDDLKARSLLEVWLTDDPVEADRNDRFHIEIGSHVLGCVQGIHAVADIAAHAAYYSLAIDTTDLVLPETAIANVSVVKLLKPNSSFSAVCRILKSIANDGNAQHIAALSNHAKHRSLISVGLHEDQTVTGTDRHALKFPAFSYKGKNYQPVQVLQLLESEVDRVGLATHQLGNAIHATLLTSAA